MDVVEHSLFPKLVKVYLYERNIAAHGGVVQDGKLLTPGTNGCLLAHHTVDSEALLWWRCERWPDFIYHQHQMSLKDKIATFGQGCDKCRKLVVVNGKFSSVHEVQAYWDWENNTTKITDLTPGSKRKIWLRCSKNHSFEISCKHFTRGVRCGACRNIIIIENINTFDTVPDAKEWWDYEENDKVGLKINRVLPTVSNIIHLKCPKGHKFIKSAFEFKNGARCYYCSGHKPYEGFNTFDTVPDAKEWWDYEKNKVKITNYTRSSDKKVYFKCPIGHSFITSCNSFTGGSRCGVCNGKSVEIGFNSFDTVPDAKEWWDYEKNTFKITDLVKNSHTKVWLKCPTCGYSFITNCNRFTSGNRCGACRGLVVIEGFNSFDLVPDAKEWWDYEKNDQLGIKITDYTRSSDKRVWLRCVNKHSFDIRIANFTLGQRCPICSSKRLLEGFNTFDTVPDAKEWWDYEENDKINLKINQIAKNSHTKVYLHCPLNHKFIASCNTFTYGHRCPYCSSNKILSGFNTFDTVPDALEWWDTEENDKIGLKITDLTKGSRKVVNLKCPKGHKYLTPACDFNSGYRCARCAKSGYSRQSLEYISCIESKYNIDIQHAENEGEFRIPNSLYRADGYVEINGEKIVIEYHGDLFHGYKGLIKQDEMSYLGKTFGELYQKTLAKEAKIRELGYTLVVIWESDYLAARDKYLSGDFAIPEIEAALAKK